MGERADLLQGIVNQFLALRHSVTPSLIQIRGVPSEVRQVHLYRGKRLPERVVQITRQAPSLIVPDLEQASAQPAHRVLSSLELQ